MRKIVGTVFVSLDGVMQAPGGVNEDITGGFAHGGWQFKFPDPAADATLGATFDGYDLLLGRRTYDIFASFWPEQSGDDPIAAKLNAVPKFVASRTLTDPSWAGTTVIADVANEVRATKERFDEIHVIGSGDLVDSLLAANLVDRLNLYVYPLTLGSGKRLFGTATIPAAFSLVQQPITFPKGAIALVYEHTGEPVTGVDISQLDSPVVE